MLCAGRVAKDLDATVKAIKRKKGKAEAVILDVTDEDSIQSQVRALLRKHRRIDVLVNNAGVIHRENIVDTATPDYRKVIETDLIGPFALAREVGRHMLAREYGRIVNISSIMAVLGRGSVAGYVSAKHGMTGLTKNLAAEFGPHVTANAIAPGYIRTELNVPLQQDKKFCAMLEQRTAAQPLGHAGRPARRAAAARLGCRRLHHRPHAGGRWRHDDHPGVRRDFGLPRWAILLFGAGLLLFGLAVSQGWIRDPTRRQVRLCRHDRRLGRGRQALPRRCRSNGRSTAGPAASRAATPPMCGSTRRASAPLLCGWLRLDKGGASIRATRWLSEARLKVGDIRVSALFIAPTDKPRRRPQRRLRAALETAGCARCLRYGEGRRPAVPERPPLVLLRRAHACDREWAFVARAQDARRQELTAHDQPRPCPALDRQHRRLSRRHQGGGPRRPRRGRQPCRARTSRRPTSSRAPRR